jgi:hypothetical protein
VTSLLSLATIWNAAILETFEITDVLGFTDDIGTAKPR